jgi:sporulation-control protein spo0M
LLSNEKEVQKEITSMEINHSVLRCGKVLESICQLVLLPLVQSCSCDPTTTPYSARTREMEIIIDIGIKTDGMYENILHIGFFQSQHRQIVIY